MTDLNIFIHVNGCKYLLTIKSTTILEDFIDMLIIRNAIPRDFYIAFKKGTYKILNQTLSFDELAIKDGDVLELCFSCCP